METVNEMTEERLADLRRDVMSQVASAGGRTRHSDAYTEMLDEIVRLRAEVERLWPWALNDFKECPDCIKCVACGGLGELCEGHAAFVWDGCDCEPAP